MIEERIKQLREKAGMSQSELARRLWVTRTSVSAWEAGLSTPTTQYIVEMAKLFRVSTDYLLGVTESESISLDGLTDEQIKLVYDLVACFEKKEK